MILKREENDMKKDVRYALGVMILFGIIMIFMGCSSANKESTFSPDTGHVVGWALADAHGTPAKNQSNGFGSCQSCHGAAFSGGIVNISCFTCHGVNAPHPSAPWRGAATTHTNTNPDNASVCALCHTNGANSSVQPSPPAPAGTAPGCFNNTLCHATPGHPVGWNAADQHGASAKAQVNGFSSCQTCHGANFSGGTALISCFTCHGVNAPHSPAPWRGGVRTHTNTNTGNASVCALCHTNGANSSVQPSPPAPAGTAPDCFNNTLCHANLSDCVTCHGTPPSGTAFPNIAGRHAVHTGLGSYIACGTCHAGAGSGTALHINGVADVIIGTAYNAKSGTASFNAASATCANVSCHGGQATPSWLTGSIDVNTQCTSCHASGTAQYNSYDSGQHSRHVSDGIACTSCHDTTKLAVNHFTNLGTQVMEGPASATINSAVNYNGTSCSPSCHGLQNWVP